MYSHRRAVVPHVSVAATNATRQAPKPSGVAPPSSRDLTVAANKRTDSPLHRIFALKWLSNGRDACAAYRDTTGSKGTAKTCSAEGVRWLQKPGVRAIIEQHDRKLEEATNQTFEKLAMSRIELIGRLVAIARSDLTDIATWTEKGLTLRPLEDLDPSRTYAVLEVSQTDRGIKVKMADKMGALNSLAKIDGLIIDKLEHAGPGGGPVQHAHLVGAVKLPTDPTEAARTYQELVLGAAPKK